MVANWSSGIACVAAMMMAVGCAQKSGEMANGEAAAKPAEKAAVTQAETKAPAAQKKSEPQWDNLFDGKDLGAWKPLQFGGDGEVQVKDGALLLPMGAMLTGVQYTGETPKINYEIELEAMRVDGNDFFCGLTFPVNESSASLILGGWGGSLCGISCLDGYDAANNETTTVREFKKKQWYRVRMRVMEKRLMAWVDDQQVVDVSTKGRKIDVRMEVEQCKPFGLATWQTTGAIKNVRVRTLEPDEVTEKPDEL